MSHVHSIISKIDQDINQKPFIPYETTFLKGRIEQQTPAYRGSLLFMRFSAAEYLLTG